MYRARRGSGTHSDLLRSEPMLVRSRSLAVLAACLLAGCAAPRPTPPPPPPPPPPFPHAVVWNRTAGAELVGDSARTELPRLAMRLEVLESDSAATALRVRCAGCDAPAEGWIPIGEVVWAGATPGEAARGDLAEFVVAVRTAAAARDVTALRPVISRWFVHSLGGGEGVLEATSAWEREGYRTLDPLPALLDRGVSADGELWVAPPEHLSEPAHRGLRTGFRRNGNAWEWMFLVRDGL